MQIIFTYKIKFISLCTMLMFTLQTYSQSNGHNYVVSQTMLDSVGLHFVNSVQYYDELGRECELVEGAGLSMDYKSCTLQQYDEMGRPWRTWMPTQVDRSFNYVNAPSVSSFATSFHNDSYPYNETSYDALGRVESVLPPGGAWHNENRRQHHRYLLNESNSVKRYKVLNSTTTTLTQDGYYGIGELTAEQVEDEDGKTTTTFKDILGRVVLERRDTENDTYYVYDTHGMLRFVIPPLYQTNPSADLLYIYRYDYHGRCIEKTLPGCSPVSYTYDCHGRLAFEQDGRLMNESLYRFYLYDKFGRLAIQGTCSNVPNNIATLSALVGYEIGAAYVNNTGYKRQAGYNLGNTNIEIVNYYDSYDFLSNNAVSTYLGNANLSNDNHACATSLLTGQIVSTSSGQYLPIALYYDERGNIIERSEGLLHGVTLKTTAGYSFTDKLLTSTKTLVRKGVTRTVNQSNSYGQNSDRLLSQQHKYGTKPAVTTAFYSYNAIGQITSMNQHNGAISTSYSYDVHGWLTDINSVVSGTGTPLFQEKLKYVDATRGMGYNGNISEARWVSGSINSSYRYKYTYDGMDRLTGAAFYAGGPINNDNASFIDDLGSVSVQYNANSSITSLVRRGQLDYGYGAIDNLIFTYSGNQLSRIAEYVPPILHEGSFDFKDNALSVSGNEYLYDACGSLTADANKGITHIDYDLLGNPVRIQFTDRSYTENVYAADGRKLKTSHVTAVPSNTHLALGEMVLLSPFHILSVDSTEYLGDFLFDNGLFKQYHFDGGYFTTTGSEASYKYYVKDHLGSNRILASYNGTIQQETQYYPYGGIHHFSTDQGTQKFKYNGKELDLMHGLNLYDYGARLYDPLVGQFTSIDPLCEKYYSVSPYAYCAGNPVNRIDPTGMDWYQNIKKEIVWTNHTSQDELEANHIQGRYLGTSVVLFQGRYNEQLGQNQNLFKDGAVLATAIVYGPQNSDDIKVYKAFTMSSNFKLFGAIDNGEYDVTYREKGKSGKLTSHWAINNTEPVNCLYGNNPSPISPYSKTQKNGVYIHSSNKNGFAGVIYSDKTHKKISAAISTGCLLIVPSLYDKDGKSLNNGWDQFNDQLRNVKSFKLILERK